jgi:hypothetical protein
MKHAPGRRERSTPSFEYLALGTINDIIVLRVRIIIFFEAIRNKFPSDYTYASCGVERVSCVVRFTQ